MEQGLGRSLRTRKSAISSDYQVQLQESEINKGINENPTSFSKAMKCRDFISLYNAMKDEMESMAKNQIWDLVDLPKKLPLWGCKWVCKTNRDLQGKNQQIQGSTCSKML